MPETKTVNNRQAPITFLDDALSEVAKIGAQGVKGVRVVSAEVKEQGADVHLVVDVEYRTDLSRAINDVQKEVSKNLTPHRPKEVGSQVTVTVAKVLRPTSGLRNKVQNFLPKVPAFLKTEVVPWIVPILFVGLGVSILWAITNWVNDQHTTVGDIVLALLLVMPILIYALISGRLTELKGPGGMEAKFTVETTKPVAETSSHDLVSFDQLAMIAADEGGKQRGQRQLKQTLRRFTEIQPIVMTITIGSDSHRTGSKQVLQEYVKQLARTRNFALVAFLDDKKDFVAYMPSWAIQSRLSDTGKAEDEEPKDEELFNAIKTKDPATLFELPGVVREKITPNTTNGEALRKMVTNNLDVIVVVDENNRLKGVVEREQVLTRMVLALTPKG